MGIGGNRVMRDGAGASALARLDRDVLSQPGVKWVTVMEGINDIGHEATVPAEAVTADEIIGAYKQLIEQAHAHGVQVIGCTLTPYEGASYYRENGEAIREAVNAWIRTSGAFDAVVDFEAATREPATPNICARTSIPAITCTPTTPGTRPWRTPSTWESSPANTGGITPRRRRSTATAIRGRSPGRRRSCPASGRLRSARP